MPDWSLGEGDCFGIGGELCGAPPVGHLLQPCAGVGGLEGVGAGAQGVVIGGVPNLDDGDVQQQRQILVGRGQVEHHGIVLTLHHTVDVGEAASVVVAVFGGLVGCQHVGNGEGEPSENRAPDFI